MKNTVAARILVLALLSCGQAATAYAVPAELSAQVSAIGPAGEVTLAGVGKAVLADIFIPDAALAEPWLAQHVLQQTTRYRAREADRYGRVEIISDVQEAMLQAGVAVIYGEAHPRVSWLAAEREARQARRGLWGQEGFVLTPAQAAQHEGEFHVVEGTITRIYDSKPAAYLNFGEDWHQDFSVAVPAKYRRGFTALLDRLKEGSRVRVRGMIYEENGPMIRVSHGEQMESF